MSGPKKTLLKFGGILEFEWSLILTNETSFLEEPSQDMSIYFHSKGPRNLMYLHIRQSLFICLSFHFRINGRQNQVGSDTPIVKNGLIMGISIIAV